jgi:alpha-methylacyl-CoA racemase
MFAPLSGTVVLDLSRYLPGPFLTRILADLGATVYKIEPPGGDLLRWMPPHASGLGAGFVALHAGKRSVVIDLKKPEGGALLRAMCRGADVLVESNRPGVLDRLGVGPAVLQAESPGLIIASLSGYGQRSTRRDAAGHDLDYLALSGVLSMQGPADGPPAVPAVQIADVGGGSWPAAVAVLAALLERGKTGRGRHLDLSLARGALAFGALALAAAAAGHTEPRGGGMLTGGVPCYRCYPTADGGAVAVGALEPQFWRALCRVIGREDLAGAAFATGADGERVMAELTATFRTRTRAAWEEALRGVDACCEPVRTLEEALADPDFADQVVTVDGCVVIRPDLGAPGELTPLRAPPALGADADDALATLRVPETLTAAARASGALG